MEIRQQFNPQEDLLNHSALQTDVEYAGFWLRLAAYIIDGIVLYLPNYLLLKLFNVGNLFDINAGFEPLSMVVSFAVYLYFPIMESSKWQATLGKRLVDIKVTDLQGDRISFVKALVKYIGTYISFITLCIGFMMAGFTEKKQALHDMIAGTLVVKSNGRAS
jgi:uncharacterized RDD family membrane protein YckC